MKDENKSCERVDDEINHLIVLESIYRISTNTEITTLPHLLEMHEKANENLRSGGK